MKTYNHIIFLVFSISTLILLSTSCNNYNGSSFDLILKKLLHSNNSEFVVTSDTHDGSENWNQVIKNEFGDSYRIADWNDLKSYHDKGGNILELFDNLGLTKYKNSIAVTKNGKQSYSYTRYYFAERHETNCPSYFMVHNQIGNNIISLGSWKGKRKLLGIKQ